MKWGMVNRDWITSDEKRVSSVELETLTDELLLSVSSSLLVSFGGRKRQKTFVSKITIDYWWKYLKLTSTGQPPPFASKSLEPKCVFFIGVRKAMFKSKTKTRLIKQTTSDNRHRATHLLVNSYKDQTPLCFPIILYYSNFISKLSRKKEIVLIKNFYYL
jgi:hypothetical protein